MDYLLSREKEYYVGPHGLTRSETLDRFRFFDQLPKIDNMSYQTLIKFYKEFDAALPIF